MIRTPGRSGLEVSGVGLRCWGEVDDAESIRALERGPLSAEVFAEIEKELER